MLSKNSQRKQQFNVSFLATIHDVAKEDWNRLVNSSYPFLQHQFLAALEDSGSVCTDTGWQTKHVVVTTPNEHIDESELVGIMPLYIKTHSWGEYVFDWAWADAYQRHALSYYPKLVSAIPFTPSTGPRICTDQNHPREAIIKEILQSVITLATNNKYSSWHILFPEVELSKRIDEYHLPTRVATQFHWFNRDYHDFDDFLGAMTSRKRKNILKERKKVAAQHIRFQTKAGSEITPTDWDLFYQYYHMTYLKRSGRQGYLSKDFFRQLSQVIPDAVLMSIASVDDKPIAAALYFKDNTTLYGRYWGCLEEYEFLHFETCYYQGIEYCIANGLKRFDAGAQGEHKIQRGFEPVETYSNHWIQHDGFREAIENFIKEEAKNMTIYKSQCKEHLPFKSES